MGTGKISMGTHGHLTCPQRKEPMGKGANGDRSNIEPAQKKIDRVGNRQD
jgi:hypothetical protein